MAEPTAAMAEPTAAWTPPETDAIQSDGVVDEKKAAWQPPETDQPLETGPSNLTVAAQGANVGVIRTGSVMATGIAGFKAGTMAAPFAGPAAPVMPIIGTIGGMALGYFGGEAAIDVLAPSGITYNDLSNVPDEQRPYAVFGEAAGGAFTPGGGVQIAARMGTTLDDMTKTGWILNRFIQTAKQSPKTFTATELGLSTGAGGGGFLAETYYPGDPAARLYGEVLGGFVNPTRVVTGTYKTAVNGVNKALAYFSESSAQTQAGKYLRDVITESGGDPAIVSRLLKDAAVTGQDLPLTSAQLTGSTALAAIEKKLIDHSKAFGAEVERNMEQSLDALRTMIIHMGQSGDPGDLQVAAQLRVAYVKGLLSARINMAQEQAQIAIGRITQDMPADKLEISRLARTALDDALSDVRAVEKEMWGAVDGTKTGEITNLAGAFQREKANLNEEYYDRLPAKTKAFIKRISKSEDGTASVDELRKLRSALLNDARMAMQGDKPDRELAGIYGRLADAVLDDLDAAFDGDVAYDTARTFSRELHDAFTRSFAGKATAKGPRGDKIMPELLMNRATAGNAESRAIQLEELEQATRFLSLRGMDDSQESLNIMMEAQERVMRLAAADAVDSLTGKLNPKRLQKFINDNENILNRFPGVKDELQNAVNSDVAAARLTKMNSGRIDRVENQTFYGTLAKKEPVTIAKQALGSDTQEKDFAALINVALKAPASKRQAAIDGLKTSVYQAAISLSTKAGTGEFQIEKFLGYLRNPSLPGGKSPIQMLQQANVISREEVASLDKIFKIANNIAKAQKPGYAVEIKEGPQTMLAKAIARMVGSRVTSAVAKRAGGNYGGRSIIVAQTGARMGDELFMKLPQAKIQDVLIEAMRDPAFAAKLIDKVADPSLELRNIQQIHGFLMSSGINNLPTVVSPDDPANEDLMP